MLKFCSQPVFLANSGFSKPAKISSLSHQLPIFYAAIDIVFLLRKNRSILHHSAPPATFGHMVALCKRFRIPLTELTMGCVYSYPLFSFQGSICFSAAKIILSNLHFLVKYYFSYLIRFCLLFFRQRMIFYQVSFSLSSTFLFIFCACFRCSCQRILVYHPQSRLSMFFFSNIRC